MKINVNKNCNGKKSKVFDTKSDKNIEVNTTDNNAAYSESAGQEKTETEDNMNITVSAINSTLEFKSIDQSKFLVIEDINLSKSVPSTWFSYNNIVDMFNRYEHESRNINKTLYTARKYRAKNDEKGYPYKEGKAIQVKVNEDNQTVTLHLHLNSDGKDWKPDYKYIVSLETFLAYKLVITNEIKMSALTNGKQHSSIIELN